MLLSKRSQSSLTVKMNFTARGNFPISDCRQQGYVHKAHLYTCESIKERPVVMKLSFWGILQAFKVVVFWLSRENDVVLNYSWHFTRSKKVRKTCQPPPPFWRSKHILRCDGKTVSHKLRAQRSRTPAKSDACWLEPRWPELPSCSDSTPQAEPRALTSGGGCSHCRLSMPHIMSQKTNRTTLSLIKHWTGKNLLTEAGKNFFSP